MYLPYDDVVCVLDPLVRRLPKNKEKVHLFFDRMGSDFLQRMSRADLRMNVEHVNFDHYWDYLNKGCYFTFFDGTHRVAYSFEFPSLMDNDQTIAFEFCLTGGQREAQIEWLFLEGEAGTIEEVKEPSILFNSSLMDLSENQKRKLLRYV